MDNNNSARDPLKTGCANIYIYIKMLIKDKT